ncbi:hypothetical protein C8R43DRAFT_1125642 [Mycena crocata]|nr:hypothetical protein C8R43DRAFT_1125642 [Mycena crocata]
MVGQARKKRQHSKDNKYDREGKRRKDISHKLGRAAAKKSDELGRAAAKKFFLIPELVIHELLFYCDLLTIMKLAKSDPYARDLVKAFFSCNLRLLVALFVSDAYVDEFYYYLDWSSSAIGGSVATSVLSFPYRHTWTPINLNILIPRGCYVMWRDFLRQRLFLAELDSSLQKGVDERFAKSVHRHVIFHSMTPGLTIHISESVTASVLTPVIGATTTLATNLITCADFYCLYTFLQQHKRALEGWYPTPVEKAVTMGNRGYRSSFSTTSWKRPCGLHCPLLQRTLNNFKDVGVFRWGGPQNQYADGSMAGVPYVDQDMVWCLGDICSNPNCTSNEGSYP